MSDLRRGFLFVALAAVLLMPDSPVSAQVVRREYAIKAGVMKLLGKFVTWPPGAAPARGEPLTIGILGKDPFFENDINQLDRIAAEERNKGGNIVVKRFASAKDYEPCHILFVSNLGDENSAEKTVSERLIAAKRVTSGSNVLIVGESNGLSRQGVVANLIYDQATNVIRLEINPDSASRAGLKLAPDLLRLKLVQIVRDSQS